MLTSTQNEIFNITTNQLVKTKLAVAKTSKAFEELKFVSNDEDFIEDVDKSVSEFMGILHKLNEISSTMMGHYLRNAEDQVLD